MTTPTQPPDPRVERIAKALAANKLSLITSVALARVLVEELGGREATVREIETVAEPVQRVTWGYDGAITATHNGAVYVLTGPEGARFEHKNLDTLILNWPQAAPHRAALETLAAQAQPSGKAGELDTRARVLVEELGAREASVQGDGKPRTIWRQVMDALEVESNGDAVQKALTLRAQQRENAETIKVLKERVELGAREANVAATEIDPRIVGWMDVCKTLDDVDPTWSTRYNSTDAAIMTIRHLSESLNACRAQQRENAETIQALRERVATAEAANTELDNARKSAEQSARDLRAGRATLRAELDAINTKTEHDQALMDTQAKLIVDLETELDAIKGAQPRFGSFRDGILSIHGTFKNDDRFDLYAHPAPALPVVGEMKVEGDRVLLTFGKEVVSLPFIRTCLPQGRHELCIRPVSAPLTTEGGR